MHRLDHRLPNLSDYLPTFNLAAYVQPLQNF